MFGSVFLEVCPTGCFSSWILSILGVWPHDILPKLDCVHYWFSQLKILLTFGLFYLGFYLPGWLFTWSLSSWELSNMTFCSSCCVSTNGSVNLGFCSDLVLSTWDYVHEGIFLLRSCTLGILFTWVFDYLDSVHLGVCPHDNQSTKFSACDKVFQISSGSPLVLSLFESVQLGVYLPGFCTLWSLATWHSFQVGLCPLLVLSTLDCAHFWFCLLGSQSTWVVVYLESVHLGVWPHDILAT